MAQAEDTIKSEQPSPPGAAGDYSADVTAHFMNPSNAGILQDAELDGAAGTPGQGPHVVMCVKLLREAGTSDRAIIADIRFRTWGCPAAIASCSKLTEMVKGKNRKREYAAAVRAIPGDAPLDREVRTKAEEAPLFEVLVGTA